MNKIGFTPNNLYFSGKYKPNDRQYNPSYQTTPDKYNSGIQKNHSAKGLRKFVLSLTSAVLMLFGASNCSESRISDQENINGTKIEYLNVNQETRDSICKPLVTLKSKLNRDNDFLKGVEINIAGSYNDLADDHSFKVFLKNEKDTEMDKGINFYSDNNLQKLIVVQADAHDTYACKNFSESAGLGYSSVPALRHSLMHEVGHQFDQYFGHDHNADFAKEWDNVLAKKEKDPSRNPYIYEDETEEEEMIGVEYKWNAGLSDKEEFQKAYLKDLQHIAKLKQQKSEKIACGVDYYTQSINFSKPLDYTAVDLADSAREETYANLFAYAIGQDDGDKEDFLENFKYSYQVVQKDIQKYLNIKTK